LGPRAGLYFSCVARGPNLFQEPSRELVMIRDAFGDFPLAGFFGNGEIANDRIYGYTGVLALFL
jgi:small ligand-binding sensory domain FIST